MRENKALSAWREDQQTIGCWLSLANAYSAEAVANLGFDWVCVDMQHGLIDYTDLVTMLPAISTSQATPIVRVPWNEPYEIMKVLDAGAYGVIVPMVNNREEAQQAVMACRYPAGRISFLWTHSWRSVWWPWLCRGGEYPFGMYCDDRNSRRSRKS